MKDRTHRVYAYNKVLLVVVDALSGVCAKASDSLASDHTRETYPAYPTNLCKQSFKLLAIMYNYQLCIVFTYLKFL